MIDTVRKTFGGTDIVVNNDGAPLLGGIESFDDVTWQKAVEQNLIYVARMARGVLPYGAAAASSTSRRFPPFSRSKHSGFRWQLGAASLASRRRRSSASHFSCRDR